MDSAATFHDLKGQSVFVTGGGSGIGAALVEGFLRHGAKVAFVDLGDAGAFVEQMQAEGFSPLALRADVTDVAALKTAMDAAADRHGPITVLINNAANDTRCDLGDYTVEAWDDAMAVNLRPHVFTAQHAAPDMAAAGGGAIINMSSISYMMGQGGYAAYTAAKAGITALTRGLARELGPQNIRVNAVMPGWVLTERQMKLWATPEALAAHLDRQCLKDHLTPDDLVAPVLFLASTASRMITGQALVVDGGVVVTG